jgi:hypothetical protein
MMCDAGSSPESENAYRADRLWACNKQGLTSFAGKGINTSNKRGFQKNLVSQ